MVILFIILLILSAILPALIWVIFYLKEDLHPEPKKLLLYVFGAGVLISLPVLFTQVFFQNLILSLGGGSLILVLGLALIEELFKFLAAYLTVSKSKFFDEPVDAMIYMIVVSLGFATVENFFIASSSLESISAFVFTNTIQVLILRFIGATMLHTLASGFIGYYWARGVMENKFYPRIIEGMILATVIHGIFNYLVLKYQDQSLLLYPSILLIAAGFFVFKDFEKLKMAKS